MANGKRPNPNEDYSTDVLDCQGGSRMTQEARTAEWSIVVAVVYVPQEIEALAAV